MERLKNLLLALLLGAFAAALLLFPAQSADAAREGLRLCLETVLPSLFPFFVLSSLLVATGGAAAFGRALEPLARPLLRVSGAGAGALALGLAGGYPSGARTIAELYRSGNLQKEEAERLLGFCNNAGPGFMLGICGGAVFHHTGAGVCLCLIHAASAVLTGFLFRGSARPADHRAALRSSRFVSAFPSAVSGSFAAAWSVCGYVVLFAVVVRMCTLLLPSGAPHPLLLGALELTNGVLALPPTRSGFVLCAAFLSWGGLSVHAQTLSTLEDSGLSTRLYWPGKLAQTVISILLALPVSLLLWR